MRLRSLESLNLIALGLVVALGGGLAAAGRLQHPGTFFGTLCALLGLVLVVARLAQHEGRQGALLQLTTNFYPLVLLPVLFNSLGPLIAALRGAPRDDLLIAADRALFGMDVTIWMEKFVSPLANDYFAIAYATYYFLAVTLGGLLWAFRRADARRFIFTIVFAYHVSYAGYFLLPALGPRVTMAERQTVSVHDTLISSTIDDTLTALERTKYDVFPSGHAMIAVSVLLVAWRRFRRVFWYGLPVVTSLVISTIYGRYHYVVDVIAGVALAAAVVPVGDWIYERRLARGRSRATPERSR